MDAHPQLGTRRICPKCRAPHYDLNKNPSVCPKCGHNYDPTAPYEPVRRGRKAAKRIEDSSDNIKENALEESMDSKEGEDSNVSAPDIEHIEDLDAHADEEMSGIASKAGNSVDGDPEDSSEGMNNDHIIDEIDDESEEE